MIQNLIFFRHQICITGRQSIIGTSFKLFSIPRKIVVRILHEDLTYLVDFEKRGGCGVMARERHENHMSQ